MIRECFLNNTGILFHSAELEQLGISPVSSWPAVTDIDEGPAHGHEATGSTLVNGHGEDEKAAIAINIPLPPRSKLVPPTPVKLAFDEDAKDAESSIKDRLSHPSWWWVLELMPMQQRYQRHDQTWNSGYS
jgi:hypothetical protein